MLLRARKKVPVYLLTPTDHPCIVIYIRQATPTKELEMIGNGTQAAQNKAHREDARWIKTKGNDFRINGQRYISEYVSTVNGWTIRKHFGTGLRDGAWYVFDTNGDVIETAHSLTFAKGFADLRMAA